LPLRIPIPSEDETFGSSPEDRSSNVILQWDLVVGNINKLSEMVKDLKSYTVHELDTMDEKILAVDAWVGRTGTSEGLK